MQRRNAKVSWGKLVPYLSLGVEVLGLGLTVVGLATDRVPPPWKWAAVSLGGILALGAAALLAAVLGKSLMGALRAGVTYRLQNGRLYKIVRGLRMRNTAMRIATIQTILENQGTPSALRQLGRRIGERFVRQGFRDRIGATEAAELPELVQAWADLDSTAGWGRFDVGELVIADGAPVGAVKVHDHFLVDGRNGSHPNLCSFTAGYIEGVLITLTGVNIALEEHECGSTRPDDRCRFRILTG